MKDPLKEYDTALADFSQPGNRWTTKGRLTYWGKAAGLTADEIITDARAAGVTDRDADIRRGWNDAKPTDGYRQNDRQRYTQRANPKPPPAFPFYVRDMVEVGGGTATARDLRELTPAIDGGWTQWDSETDTSFLQTRDFLSLLFDPADVLHIFRDDTPTAGKPGQNLMHCSDWLARLEHGEAMHGDLIVANPFTGEEANTTDGRKSYIAQSCLACFPFVVIEFDTMPLKVQAAFWRGILAKSPLAPKVAALVYSGGKSIHGLLHVGCRTLTDWQKVREQLRGLLAADPDPAFRADEQAMRPRTGTRLPGVRRFDNCRRQTLLYLNPEAVRPIAEKPDTTPIHAKLQLTTSDLPFSSSVR